MNILEILLIAISLSMDAFAVCLGVGTTGKANHPRPTFRLAFHFGLFQFLMPIIGWLAGTTVEHYISAFDHWIAFGLLAFVGVRMVWTGFHPGEEEKEKDPSRGLTLVILAFATSIDALAVGLSLGVIGMTIWYPAVIIGLVTGLLSWLGIRLGKILGEKVGKRMEIIGGLILIAIGLRIVLAHIFG